jgi:hypothetical protein
MWFVLLFVILALYLAGSGAHLGLSLLVGITFFVGFWVLVIKGLIGFGRWLMAAPDRPRFPKPAQFTPIHRATGRPSRTSGDPRCGRANLAEAKYCAQCGRPLGQAA